MNLKQHLYILLALLLLVVCNMAVAQSPTTATAATTETASTRPVVYRVEIREAMISEGMPFFLHRAVEAAKAADAKLIILDIDTPGGSLAIHMEMRDILIDLDIPIISYINDRAWSAGSLIAVVADKIVMSPTSSIGGAQVITSTGASIDPVVEQKMNSMLKAELRATAKHKGYPVIICEAFVDRNIEIPGLSPKGEILTMDFDEATTSHTYTDSKTSETITVAPIASYVADDIAAILDVEGLAGAEIRQYELDWSEKIAKLLLAIKPLLLLVALASIYLEIKTPGVGVFLAMGLIALALFFFATNIADLSGVIEIVLVAIGLILLAAEIFVIPGFGVAGASGLICIFAGLILAMIKMPPPEIGSMSTLMDQVVHAFGTILMTCVGMVLVLLLGAYYLPRTSVFRFIELNPEDAQRELSETSKDAHRYSGRQPDETDLTGQTGTALTDLRPSGTARVDGHVIDAQTRGDYIDAGQSVLVLHRQGPAWVVKPVKQHEKHSHPTDQQANDDPFNA